jgi:hypothetical protein
MPHYNRMTGLPCSCLYGEPRRPLWGPLWVQASQYVNQIRNQNQKLFRTPEGQDFLRGLDELMETYPESERMAPWLAARYKHGDVTLGGAAQHVVYANGIDPKRMALAQQQTPIEFARTAANNDLHPHSYAYQRVEDVLPQWTQWFHAGQHPTRRGVNIMELTPEQVQQRAREHHQDVESKRQAQGWLNEWGETGEPVYHFGGPLKGWHVARLRNGQDAEAESDAVGHCIGHGDQPYREAIDDERIQAYSLRDPHGYPHVSWHFNPSGSLAHIQGKSGSPNAKYRDMISEFHAARGLPDKVAGEESIHNYDQQIQFPDPETVEDYMAQFGPERDWDALHEMAYHLADNGVGEETEYLDGSPSWSHIHDDVMKQEPEDRDHFYNTVMYNGHKDGFGSEAQAYAYSGDPDYTRSGTSGRGPWTATTTRTAST